MMKESNPADGASLQEVFIGDGWTIRVPNGFAEERESNNALVLWDEQRTIRIRTVFVSGRAGGSPISAREMLGEPSGELVEGADGVLIDLEPELSETIHDETVATFPVRAAAENSILVVYFHFRSGNDKGWVRATALSLVHK